MALTEKQKAELNSAILEYLKDNGYNESFQAFQKESQSVIPDSSLKVLERKWVSIVRLTKKVNELESKNLEYEQELKEAKPFSYQDPKSKHKIFDDTLPNNQLFIYKCHQKGINRVLFHPTYSWFVSCGDTSQIAVCDHENGKFDKWIRGHTNSIHDLSFNNNGTLLASASADMSIKIWNFEDEFRCMKTLNGHDHVVTGVTFCRHNDDILVSCSRDGTVKFWDLTTGYTTNTLQNTHDGEWVKKIIVSFDGSMFATCSVDQCVKVFDFKTGQCIQTLRGHNHVVECITFSHPSTEEIISGKTREEMKKKDTFDDYENAPLYIASGSRDKTIIIWNIKTGDIVMTLKGHENWVRNILFHPCGRFLISCGDDKSIRFWDLALQRQKSVIENAHESFVSTIDWNSTCNLLISGSSSKVIKAWNYDSKQY